MKNSQGEAIEWMSVYINQTLSENNKDKKEQRTHTNLPSEFVFKKTGHL